jgi:putative ABC transport system permease protein
MSLYDERRKRPAMIEITLKMLLHKRSRFLTTLGGTAALFFLCAAQVGLLVGWCNTTSAIVRHADADVWVMANQTPAFDYGTAIPGHCVYQVRSVPGVAWAEGMFMAWNTWQRPDGRRVNIELIGLDDSSVGGPWKMREGRVEDVHLPEGVLVDALFLDVLGIHKVGDEVEFYGERAIVRGITEEVRTFTASPFVFTSIESARRYDKRYRQDEVTYVLARCEEGTTAEQVRDRIAAEVPNVMVLTADEFAQRTIRYWMLETGVGITVVITAILGFLVAAVVTSQTLYATTQEHVANYATLLALGFRRSSLAFGVLLQSMVIGTGAILLGSAAFFFTAHASATTPIPLETTTLVFAGIVLVSLGNCAAASFLSIRSVFRVDPALVFRA